MTTEEKLKEAIDLLDECRLQIEYLHNKFEKTGTSESVLARINAFDGSCVKQTLSEEQIDKLAKEKFPPNYWTEYHRNIWKQGG